MPPRARVERTPLDVVGLWLHINSAECPSRLTTFLYLFFSILAQTYKSKTEKADRMR